MTSINLRSDLYIADGEDFYRLGTPSSMTQAVDEECGALDDFSAAFIVAGKKIEIAFDFEEIYPGWAQAHFVIAPLYLNHHARLPGGRSNRRIQKKRVDYLERWWTRYRGKV